MQPHRWQPTRLHCSWDSPGKNPRVGCHFLPQCMKVKSKSEVTQSCPILCDPMDCSLWGSSVHEFFQTRVLEWGAIAFSTANPREYQIVRTHTKETFVYNPREYQIVRSHTKETFSTRPGFTQPPVATLCRTPHLNNKQNKDTNHLTQPCPLEEKLTNKQKNSAQISPYMKLTQTIGPVLGGQKPKGRKNSTLKHG